MTKYIIKDPEKHALKFQLKSSCDEDCGCNIIALLLDIQGCGYLWDIASGGIYRRGWINKDCKLATGATFWEPLIFED